MIRNPALVYRKLSGWTSGRMNTNESDIVAAPPSTLGILESRSRMHSSSLPPSAACHNLPNLTAAKPGFVALAVQRIWGLASLEIVVGDVMSKGSITRIGRRGDAQKQTRHT